ncbi:hypothetical protein ERX37_00630 [Macrococcus hajekii]|uniref:Uncharacterized protein n=1 Tax=Macrococcus hajekii TaxID=198482 RepID=A0A4V3BEE1_9STAP|nr:DUF6366 family protein [Macrococcus hajekii]TDM02625.1 hypothetical protein ERX37_00630 [Macrococcus hajekii]GGB02580.1 hypothetical protein GCM10007190_08180 [Macrococcus hajekii]
MNHKPSDSREELRQQELNNSLGNLNDSMNESQRGLADLTGGMSSTAIGLVILLLLLLVLIGWLLFQ